MAPPTGSAARIELVANGGMHDWHFDVHGLPAIDTRTGELLVADLGERPFGWDSATLLSLPAARTVMKLVDSQAIGELHVIEDEEAEVRFRDQIAAQVTAQTRLANADLARRALRSLTACRLPADAPMIFCRHPQTLACGTRSFAIGDQLPTIPPMPIGDGPPKTMIACIEEAHFDAPTSQLAIRFHQVCADGGSDACILQDEWRVLKMP